MTQLRCKPPSFQLELMQHDKVMRESFQKLSDWLCKDLLVLIDDAREIIASEDSPPTLLRTCACDPSVFVRAAVRSSGVLCVNAQANTEANSRVLGIVVAKSSPTVCTVILSGESGDIFAGLLVNSDYFLSPTIAGGVQTAAPTTSGHVVAPVGRSISANNLDVSIELRMQRA